MDISLRHALSVSAITCVLAATPEVLLAQASGTLLNNADFPITYQTGVADASGRIAWDTHKLAPCERHTFTWPLSGPPGLVFRIPHWKDSRREPDGSVRMNQYLLRMLPEGALTTINVWMGTTLGISTTGNTQCGAASTPGTPPAEPKPRANPAEVPVRPDGPRSPDILAAPEFLSWLEEAGERDRARMALLESERWIARAEKGEVMLFAHDDGAIYPVSIENVATMLSVLEVGGGATEAQIQAIFRSLQADSRKQLEQLRSRRGRLNAK